MTQGIQLLFGGSDTTNGDYSRLHRLAKAGRGSPWGCPKKTTAGDRLLIYIEKPQSAIIASAVALKDAAPGKNWRYEVRIGKIRILKNPITLAEMRLMFPKWAWLRYPRAYTYLAPEISRRLWKRSQEGASHGSARGRSRRAGFGDAATNPLVERAAIQRVRRHLRQSGHRVVSRERERIGYDLEATKGGRVLHVEVKGVSGNEPQFPITASEVRRARRDSAFRLYVVTEARSRRAKLHCMTGTVFQKQFRLTPLSFMAQPKSDARISMRTQ